MLIYARNQTFCSKSVNKAKNILIFGLNTLCGILSIIVLEKNAGFINFLCIFTRFMNISYVDIY